MNLFEAQDLYNMVNTHDQCLAVGKEKDMYYVAFRTGLNTHRTFNSEAEAVQFLIDNSAVNGIKVGDWVRYDGEALRVGNFRNGHFIINRLPYKPKQLIKLEQHESVAEDLIWYMRKGCEVMVNKIFANSIRGWFDQNKHLLK
jgi:hypothetical protein